MSLTPLHSHNSLTPWSVFQDGSWTHAVINNLQVLNLILRRRENFSTSERCCWLGSKTSSRAKVMCTRFPFNDFRSVSSPFEVLFNFPSGYLFAIDLSPLFSHGWRLPPHLRSTPKERDSFGLLPYESRTTHRRDYHPLWRVFQDILLLNVFWQQA